MSAASNAGTTDAMLDALLNGEWDVEPIVLPSSALTNDEDPPNPVPTLQSAPAPSPEPSRTAAAVPMLRVEPTTFDAARTAEKTQLDARTAEENETMASVLSSVEGLLEGKVIKGKISAEEKADIERRHHLFEMYAEGRITEEEFAQATSANTQFSEVAVSKPDVPESVLNKPRGSRRLTLGGNVLSLFAMRRKKHALFSEAPKPASQRAPSTPPDSLKPVMISSDIPGKKSTDTRCFQRAGMDWSCAYAAVRTGRTITTA